MIKGYLRMRECERAAVLSTKQNFPLSFTVEGETGQCQYLLALGTLLKDGLLLIRTVLGRCPHYCGYMSRWVVKEMLYLLEPPLTRSE